MAPPHANDVVYNAKLLSEKLSKVGIGSVEIPAPFLGDRVTVPHDSWADVPQLDFSEANADEVGFAKKLVDAATEWGFFTFTNHGIPQELIEEIQAEGHKFFNLPLEVKQKIGLSELFLGYCGDYQAFKLGRMIWSEALMMNIRSTQPEDYASIVWPEGAPTFSVAIRKYWEAVKKVQLRILQLLAIGLGLEKDFFAKHFASHIATRDQLRWNYYPPCPKPLDVLGAVAHIDSLIMTILHDGEVGGLQVEKNGEWRGIKPVKGALVFNSGEFLKVWTNDKLKSPLHRVVVNEAKARMSTLVFLNVADSTVISAPSSLVEDVGKERKYRDFLIPEFYKVVREFKASGNPVRAQELIAEKLGFNSGKATECVEVNTAQ